MHSLNMPTKSFPICLLLQILSFPAQVQTQSVNFLRCASLIFLIPLSAAASRGDQILNANSFRSQGFSYVLEEEELSNTTLLEAIEHVFHKKEAYMRQWKQ